MTSRLAAKISLSLFLLTMALSLMWYGVCTERIASKDLEFQKEHSSFDLFPESLFLKGNLAYYLDLNTPLAIEYFKRAISGNPLAMDAWFALAKAEMARGNQAESRKIVDTVAPFLSQVSTWKWQEFLLAADMRDENHFRTCFNFFLTRLPHRIPEACYLALQFWGGWGEIAPHVASEGRTAFLNELMKANEADVSVSVWKAMENEVQAPERNLQLRFCQFLIGNKRLETAKEVWFGRKNDVHLGIDDGGFESEPINKAFGWRFGRHPEVTAERTLETPFSGTYCLHVRFRGTENVNFYHVSQIVPVEPGRTYRLRFSSKSRNLNTDQGVFVNVSGYGCKGLNVQSEPVLGSTPWTKEELQVAVPESCEAILLQVRRKESLMFNNKISGDYWLDGVEMEKF